MLSMEPGLLRAAAATHSLIKCLQFSVFWAVGGSTFTVGAVINISTKGGSLKQQIFILSQCGGQKAKTKVSGGLCSL